LKSYKQRLIFSYWQFKEIQYGITMLSKTSELRKSVKLLQSVCNELSLTKSFNELSQKSVLLGVSKLGFDRLSLWFTTSTPLHVKGAFGIDENGDLRDERDCRLNISENSLMGQVLTRKKQLIFIENECLRDSNGQVVGHGNHAIAPLWNGREVIGCVCTDNLLSHKEIDEKQLLLLELYASGIGHTATVKRAEEELKKNREELYQAQKLESLGKLAGGIAHDLNNLLTPMLCHSELALRLLDENQPARTDVIQIQKAAQRAKKLSQNLLAIGKNQPLDSSFLDLNQVIGEFHTILRQLISENIEIIYSLGINLFSIKAEKIQLEQIIMNLGLNSQDAMPKGGKLSIETANEYINESSIEVNSELSPGYYVTLTIKDTGTGIDPNALENIFQPFFSTKIKDTEKGNGLGLSSVKDIVKQYNGTILVFSTPACGSIFKIYFPGHEN
jgi:signal transduction histidine kinase